MKLVSNKAVTRLSLGLAASGAITAMALAQGAITVSRTQVVGGEGGTCPVLLISLSEPMTLQGQSVTDGSVLVVQLDDRSGTTSPAASETMPAVDIPNLGRATVTLAHSATGSTLTLRLATAPARMSARQAGPASLIVAITPTGPDCGATEAPAQPTADDTAPDIALVADTPAALLAEARSSLADGDSEHAIQVLTKLLSGTPSPEFPAAREMLGLAHERSGQSAHAMAEYRQFLADYPGDEGEERVRQRLLALETAEATMTTPLREPGSDATPVAPAGAPTALAGGEANPRITSIPRRNDSFPPLGPQPGRRGSSGRGGSVALSADGSELTEPTDNFEASVSLYYYRNQSSVLITELETDTTEEETNLLQNSFVLNWDLSDSVTKDGRTFDWRFAGEEEVDMIDSADSGLSFNRAYGQLTWGEGGPSVAFGRQSWSDDATLGRYDGLRFTTPLGDRLRLGVVAGLDVGSTSDPLFAGESQVAGVTGEVLGLPKGTEVTGFGFVTRTDGFTDRADIGAEASWSSENQSVYGMVDYNLAFGQVDAARLTWSGQFADKSSLSVTADFSHSPGLSLSNALTGQQDVTSLSALNGSFTLAQMEALARDRTSEVEIDRA